MCRMAPESLIQQRTHPSRSPARAQTNKPQLQATEATGKTCCAALTFCCTGEKRLERELLFLRNLCGKKRSGLRTAVVQKPESKKMRPEALPSTQRGTAAGMFDGPLPEPTLAWSRYPDATSDTLLHPEVSEREMRSAFEVGKRIGSGQKARIDEV